MIKHPKKAVVYAWLAGFGLLCAFFIRPTLFQPVQPGVFEKTEKRLRALWLGAIAYHVDYATFPLISPAQKVATPLTTPIAYLTDAYADPFSAENKEKVAGLDIDGARAVGRVRVLYVLVLVFGLATVFLGVLPLKPWGLEQIMLLWVMFCLPVLVFAMLANLGPGLLGSISLALFLACPWGLFLFRKLSMETLLIFSLSVLMILIALYRQERMLLWVSVGIVGLGGARVVAASDALGRQWLEGWRKRKVSLALQLEVCALCLTIVAGLTSILMSDWIVREKRKAREIEFAGLPFTVISNHDFFLASSNGPDFLRDWREDDIFALMQARNERSVERYLDGRRYDPSNGTQSNGDYIIFSRRPEAPLKIDPFPQKIPVKWASSSKESAEEEL